MAIVQRTLADETVIGTVLDDLIVGGGGTDTLTGNGGNDTFIFTTSGTYKTTPSQLPYIADFSAGDRIGIEMPQGPVLSFYDSVGAATKPFGVAVVAGGTDAYPRTFLKVEMNGDGNTDLTIALNGRFSASGFSLAQSGLARTDYVYGATISTGGASEGSDSLIGTVGNDSIYGLGGADTLRGGDGADMLYGNMGMDWIWGGLGADSVYGGKDADWVYGDEGDDLVCGDMGNDAVVGGDGNDTLRGGRDNDYVSGGAGDDWLWGDLGDDRMYGGAGADVFVVRPGDGTDVIDEFNFADGDRIKLMGNMPYTASTNTVGSAVIAFSDGSSLSLLNTNASLITSDWFIFG